MISRVAKDRLARIFMQGFTVFFLFLLFVMGLGLYYKSILVIHNNSVVHLLFSLEWSPLNGKFGFYSFIVSTVYVTVLAIIISFPISLLTALYLTQNSPKWAKKIVFPILDILASIPSVVYGAWGILTVVPYISKLEALFCFTDHTSGYTVLAGGVVLSVMLLPLLINLFIEIFSAVPKEYKEASASLGATRWQTSRKIVLRKASSGIIASIVLAVSKSFGETMAVLMVCGSVLKRPESLFDACYPLSALIANNFGEMMSIPMYESALMFAALIMFIIILIFNAVSRMILQHIEKSFKL